MDIWFRIGRGIAEGCAIAFILVWLYTFPLGTAVGIFLLLVVLGLLSLVIRFHDWMR